jgi:drug/metabolite transporter (DMT)-like permease
MSHDSRHREVPTRAGEATAVLIVVVACAVSAGAHAGLVPEHLGEATALGISFGLAAVLLLAAGAALAIRPGDRRAAVVAAVLLAGLIAFWAASRLTGIPILQPRAEPVDAVGLVTKLVEALGLAVAAWLVQPVGDRRSSAIQEASR